MIVFACPECDSELEVSDKAAGTKVTCPDCGERFVVPTRGKKPPAERERVQRSAATGRTAKRSSRPTQRKREREASGSSTGLILACVGGGVLLCAGLGVGAYFLFHDAKKETTTTASTYNNDYVQSAPPVFKNTSPQAVIEEKKPAVTADTTPPLPGLTSGPASGQDVYRHVLKSVAWILVRSEAGEVSMGTGSLVDRANRLVLTNDHVIRGGSAIIVFFPNFRDGQPIAEREGYLAQVKREDVIRARVIATEVRRDLALIQIDKIPEGVEPLALARKSVDIGQTVHSVGNPGSSGALWVYTSGTVRQVYEKTWRSADSPEDDPQQGGQMPPGMRGPGSAPPGMQQPDMRQGGRGGMLPPGMQQPGRRQPRGQQSAPEGFSEHHARVVETQSPTNPGDSGGPLVNDRGELVGVTHGGMVGAQLLSLFLDVTEAIAFIEGTCKEKGLTWERATRSLQLGSNPNDILALMKAIENPDENYRAKAIQLLGSIGADGKMGIPPLLKILRDDSTRDVTRSLVLEALAKIGPPDKKDSALLLECLRDRDPKVRSYAAMAMGKLGPDAASGLTALLRAAKDSNEEVRQNALRALGKMGTDTKETVVPVLSDALKDKDREARIAAAEALTGLESLVSADVPLLIGLLKHQDSQARVFAARALGRLGEKAKAAVPGLIEAFGMSDPTLRQAAIEAMANIGPEAKGAVPAYTQALSDEDKNIRKNACAGLAKIGADSKPAVTTLAKLLKDSDKDVRKNAAIALGKIGAAAKDAVAALAEAIKDASIRVEVLTAIGEIGPAAKAAVHDVVLVFTFSTIVNGQRMASKELDELAAKTLGKIGKDAVPGLIHALENDNNLVRYGAAVALGEIGPAAKKAGQRLAIHARNDVDYQVREVAGLALSKIMSK